MSAVAIGATLILAVSLHVALHVLCRTLAPAIPHMIALLKGGAR